MTRHKLQNRRGCTTFDIVHGNNSTKFTVSIGGDSASEVTEVFISAGKAGSEVQAAVRDAAILTSLALQHGCGLSIIDRALTRDDNGRPASVVGSVVEAMARLALEAGEGQ